MSGMADGNGRAERRQPENMPLRVAFEALDAAETTGFAALGISPADRHLCNLVRAREVLAALREAGMLAAPDELQRMRLQRLAER
jgi:hypothetical protein